MRLGPLNNLAHDAGGVVHFTTLPDGAVLEAILFRLCLRVTHHNDLVSHLTQQGAIDRLELLARAVRLVQHLVDDLHNLVDE
jgi:hypothetical protein